MQKDKKDIAVPTIEEIETERSRINYQSRFKSVIKSTVYTLIVVAAVAILSATLFLPFLRIYGTSMTPTLVDGDIICCLKTSDFEPGDIVAFYYNNKILVKRVIGSAGDWVDMDSNGTVFVNGELLYEPYIVDKALGEGDIEFPYQVPDGKIFVLGDHRSSSVDSRHSSVGCVADEQIVGKILFRVWPLSEIEIFS